MTPCGRSCHRLCICAVNSISRDGCSCLPRHALLAKDLVTWQAMVGRHILEDIVGESRAVFHYPVDKWHLGDDSMGSTIGVKIFHVSASCQSALKGPLKMIVCPKKLLSTLSHLVKLLYATRQ
ncbi:hypothetical protein TNCV_4118371 [Trichonephila clavipes]|nr:hypothetical protein TNCV_4118371 [Trichonephila clavipes]